MIVRDPHTKALSTADENNEGVWVLVCGGSEAMHPNNVTSRWAGIGSLETFESLAGGSGFRVVRTVKEEEEEE